MPADNATCTFDDNGTYRVNVRVTDTTDGSATDFTNVVVRNVAPQANFNSPTVALREGTDTFSLSLTDPSDPSGVDTARGFTYSFDCDGNGTYEKGPQAADNVTCPAIDDGPGLNTVGAKIADKDNGASTYSHRVTVLNVAPTLTGSIGVSPQQALVGQNVTFTAPTPSDPSQADTARGFTFNWYAGNTTSPFATGLELNPLTSNAFSTNQCGAYSVSATATDKDNGVSNRVAASSSVSVYDATFRPPIDGPATNLTQKGKVIPVKISVGCNGQVPTGLTPAIKLLNGDVRPGSEGAGDVVEAYSSSAADQTAWMRPVDGGYLYNLQVPGGATVAVGQEFTIRVSPFATAANPNPAGGAIYAVLKIRK